MPVCELFCKDVAWMWFHELFCQTKNLNSNKTYGNDSVLVGIPSEEGSNKACFITFFLN